MSDLLTGLLVLAALSGIYVLMFHSMRGQGRPASSLKDLARYDESAWGIALLSGFAVNDILRGFGSWGVGSGASNQIATLAMILTIIVGWSCGFGTGKGLLVQLPAALVGAFAAILKSIETVRSAIATSDWLLVAMVIGIGLLFGLFLVVRFLVAPASMAGLAWYAALEAVLLLAGPFGVTIKDLAGGSQVVLLLLQVAIPIALAFLPSVILNLFACAVVLAEVYLSFLGYGADLLTTMGFAITALVGYLIGAWMRRGFSSN